MKTKLKTFTCWYFRYWLLPNGEEYDAGLRFKVIKASDIEDARARWRKQNPRGDVYREIINIEDEHGVMHDP